METLGPVAGGGQALWERNEMKLPPAWSVCPGREKQLVLWDAEGHGGRLSRPGEQLELAAALWAL